MSKVHKSTSTGKSPAEDQVDLREQTFNDCEVGPIDHVQLSVAMITTLRCIVLDLDRHLFRDSAHTAGARKNTKKFFRLAVSKWLERHGVLAAAEVRDTGRGLHVLIQLAEPIILESDGDRDRWAGIVQVIQGVLPIDPDQPGITALTRPIDSINSKTGRKVKLLKPGTPVATDDVVNLYDQLVHAPFRTVMSILFGAERVSPCPICGTQGSSLAAMDRVGQCYGRCGKVTLAPLYDVFLEPRQSESEVTS